MGISRVEGGSNKKNQWGKHGCFLEFVIDLEKRFKFNEMLVESKTINLLKYSFNMTHGLV